MSRNGKSWGNFFVEKEIIAEESKRHAFPELLRAALYADREHRRRCHEDYPDRGHSRLHREFRALLDLVGQALPIGFILMGDLVNKSPDPGGVIRTVRSLAAICLKAITRMTIFAGRPGRPVRRMKACERGTS